MAFVHFVQICDKTELMTLGYAHLQQKPQLTDERSTNTTPQTVGHAGHNRQLDAAAPLETIQWSSSPVPCRATEDWLWDYAQQAEAGQEGQS